MNLGSEIILAPMILAGVSFAFTLLCLGKQRKTRGLLDFAEKQIEDLQVQVDRKIESVEAVSQRVAEQSRRIAWLESRIRNPKAASDEVLDEIEIHNTPKLNITERRHLVMSLASKGQNVEEIAVSLGMLPGEVDLIINLSQAAAANK